MSSQTILLVDDEQVDRFIIRRVLERENYTVLEADTYQRAVQLFDEHQDAITFLIADISLPGGNGCDLALNLRHRKPEMRVLFVSGHVGAEFCRFYGLEVSDLHYLSKPFKPSDLRSRILKVLNSDEPFPRRLVENPQKPPEDSFKTGAD